MGQKPSTTLFLFTKYEFIVSNTSCGDVPSSNLPRGRTRPRGLHPKCKASVTPGFSMDKSRVKTGPGFTQSSEPGGPSATHIEPQTFLELQTAKEAACLENAKNMCYMNESIMAHCEESQEIPNIQILGFSQVFGEYFHPLLSHRYQIAASALRCLESTNSQSLITKAAQTPGHSGGINGLESRVKFLRAWQRWSDNHRMMDLNQRHCST
ncbi:hypothetical protein C8R44DRAFT_752278 [Mycena epipterygia]|nr:hypothetical protein C8R44DRAFT_752278 [Mycena epipterygia]